MSLPTLGAGLLIAGGLISALPPVSDRLTQTLGGRPVVQVVLGVISVVVGAVLISQTM